MRWMFWLALVCASTCSANTLLDPFAQSQASCTQESIYPYSTCDVIGTEINYDIQMVSMSISGDTATVNLYLDSGAPVQGSGGNMYFGSFSDSGFSMALGDLFFYSPNTPYDPSSTSSGNVATLAYVVPVSNHDSLTAGNLYQVTGSETAQTALGNPGVWYRPSVIVLATGGTLAGTGTETIASYGDGATSALFDVTLVFNAADLASLIVNGQIGLLFSSADCANDLIIGDITADPPGTPEPQSLSLIVGGLGLLLGMAVWRRRTGRALQAA